MYSGLQYGAIPTCCISVRGFGQLIFAWEEEKRRVEEEGREKDEEKEERGEWVEENIIKTVGSSVGHLSRMYCSNTALPT